MAYDKDPTRVTRQSKQLQGVMQCYLYKIYTDSTVKRTKLLKHLPVDELRFVVSLLIGRWVRSSYSKKEKKNQQHQKLWSSCARAAWSIHDKLMRVCCYFNEPPALCSTELFSNLKHNAAKLTKRLSDGETGVAELASARVDLREARTLVMIATRIWQRLRAFTCSVEDDFREPKKTKQ